MQVPEVCTKKLVV